MEIYEFFDYINMIAILLIMSLLTIAAMAFSNTFKSAMSKKFDTFTTFVKRVYYFRFLMLFFVLRVDPWLLPYPVAFLLLIDSLPWLEELGQRIQKKYVYILGAPLTPNSMSHKKRDISPESRTPFPIKQTKLTPPSRYLQVRRVLDHQCVHQEDSCGCFDESNTRQSQLESERDGLRTSLTAAKTQNGTHIPRAFHVVVNVSLVMGHSFAAKDLLLVPFSI
jgi:hypothetical protein